jgi:uncharacterized membrane protein YhaH (DUF805 family)
MDFAYLLTSFDGRINRKPYWMGVIVIVVAAIVLGFIIGLVAFASPGLMQGLLVILQLAIIYPAAALMAKRLHDRNRPTWWVAIALAPSVLVVLLTALGVVGKVPPGALDYLLNLIVLVIGIWFFIELGCLRGTVGPNEYGPDPLEGQPR